MDHISKLTEYFKKFPGIGERQAKRFVYFLLFTDKAYTDEIAELILKVKENIHQCQSCFCFFPADSRKESNLCEICASPTTDITTLLIVEKDTDMESVERSGYRGKFFILGGMAGNFGNNKSIRMDKLIQTVENSATKKEEKLKEVIIAMSLSTEGEHTDFVLRETLGPLSIKHGFKISSLGLCGAGGQRENLTRLFNR